MAVEVELGGVGEGGRGAGLEVVDGGGGDFAVRLGDVDAVHGALDETAGHGARAGAEAEAAFAADFGAGA